MAAPNTSIVYVSCSKGDCVDVFALDRVNGELSKVETVALPGNGMPIAIAPNQQFLYAAVASLGSTAGPQYEAFRIARANGKLQHLSTVKAPGRMSHITVDRSGRHLLGASVSNDLVSSNVIEADGCIRAEPTEIRTVPSKAHQITTDSSNQYAFVPNLGADLIMQLVFDPDTGRFEDNMPPVVDQPKGAAPRHMAHHPNGQFAYLLNEENGTIAVFKVGVGGGLEQFQASSYLPGGDEDKAWGAQILMTPNGRYLYASDRTSSTICLHIVDAVTGRIDRRASLPTEACPRNFAIDPSGQYLIAAGEKSDRITCYAIDGDTGDLAPRSSISTGSGPIWIEVLELN